MHNFNKKKHFFCSLSYPKTQFYTITVSQTIRFYLEGENMVCRIQFICPSIHKLSTHRHIISGLRRKRKETFLCFLFEIKTELILIENVKSINCVIHKQLRYLWDFFLLFISLEVRKHGDYRERGRLLSISECDLIVVIFITLILN